MSLARRIKWLAVGDIPTPDEWEKLIRDANDRLDELKELKLKVKAQDSFFEVMRQGLSIRIDMLEAENKKLKEGVESLKLKHDTFESRVLGWQEGFAEGVKSQLQHLDERIAKLLESDDSADFEIRQWIEEMQALRKAVKALEKRVEAVENIKPILVPVRDAQSDRTPVVPLHVPPYQPIRTWPGSDPLNPPWKITCQAKDEACE